MGRGQGDDEFREARYQLHGRSTGSRGSSQIEILDHRFNYDEERIQSLCMDRGKVLFVVTVLAEENVCRIISARKATRHEQEQYFQGGPLFS